LGHRAAEIIEIGLFFALAARALLYWNGALTVIDFPQAVDPRFNPNARALFDRDVENVCRYFNQFGVGADAWSLADDLWRRWKYADL
jgi:RIO kinase 1